MTKIIVTLGPVTNTLEKVTMIKSKGVDFVRINMSHSTLEDLNHYIDLAKKADIPFIIDTEGSQVRTGNMSSTSHHFKENDKILLHNQEIMGDSNNISIRPMQILNQFHEGDILYVDFDTLVLRISDTSHISKGCIEATVISSGLLGKNKGIVIDPQISRKFDIPTLSDKDIAAIKIGLKNDISFVAASFIRNEDAVKLVREISNGKMKIISKIECIDALENLDKIIKESDYLLIDRGDLSKEIPIEKIPFTQKIILERAKNQKTDVFVATNLLESMIYNRKPTRAEVHDIINTIVDGAYGLTMAAETAIGKYPIGCINMLNKIINHSNLVINAAEIRNKERNFVNYLEKNNYLLDNDISSSLVTPHGGKLVRRVANKPIDKHYLNSLLKIKLTNSQQLDLEQIAIGTYSPIEGFMNKFELESVLDTMRLPDETIWPIPILLDIDKEKANQINEGDIVALFNDANKFIATINVSDIFTYNKKLLIEKLYGTVDSTHPGIELTNSLQPFFIGGKITLYNKMKRDYDKYNLTPRQTRRLFDEKNWSKVVGFHTRNVIHRAHEFIQLNALEKGKCDGLFIHPVVGKKKTGDYHSNIIIESYEIMQNDFYPDNKTVFGVFATYSRYAGEREALFTALCRKNYGCSHFIVGRDHTGVGNRNKSSDNIFTHFPDLGIEIITFNQVYYSKINKSYFEESNKNPIEKNNEKLTISGTKARNMFNNKIIPPSWYMRPEISSMIIESLKAKEEVFLK
jgi:pyruvate kinase